MSNTPHRSYPLNDRSDVGLLKRDVRGLAVSLGFSVSKVGEIDIIVAELASNLVKYAKAGEVLVRPIPHTANPGLELISVDSGPGITDPARMMADGVSTGGSLGQGLGAIGRLSSLFQLYSLPGRLTIGLVRVFRRKSEASSVAPAAIVRAVVVPKTNQTACGDGYFCRLTTNSLRVFLGDGLGHGLRAQQAVEQAIQALQPIRNHSPAAWLTTVHQVCSGTRGLVGTAALFDFSNRRWVLCGVGNIQTQLSSQHQTKRYMAQNGIIGYNIPTVLLEHELPYEPGQSLVLASDGIQSRWNVARYPNVGRYDPSVLAAAIYKENARPTDDMSVLVARLT